MKRTWTLLWISAPVFVSGTALAQAGEGAPAEDVSVTAAVEGAEQVEAGGAAVPQGTVLTPFAMPTSAGTVDTSPPTTVDTGGSDGVLRGNPNSGMALSSPSTKTPETYTVKRGDTLWGISDLHFSSPWAWPKVWSFNPEIQNPHWIYPGDQVRLRMAANTTAQHSPRSTMTIGSGGGLVLRKAEVPKNTIFLRDRGYVADQIKDIWGEIGGSPEERMLLSTGSDVYLEIKKDQDVEVGQELTIFRPLRHVGEDKGTIVSILGTARVDRWDSKTRIARAQIIEALDVIERGAKIGPVGRRFDVVPPEPSEVDVWAKITTSLYPHVLYGQEQVVFIDKGAKDGLRPGNRLFVVARGDAWRKSLSVASEYAAARPDDEGTGIEKTGRTSDNEENYPEEVIGEIRVLRVRDQTATCLVTSVSRELEPGFQVVARKGY